MTFFSIGERCQPLTTEIAISRFASEVKAERIHAVEWLRLKHHPVHFENILSTCQASDLRGKQQLRARKDLRYAASALEDKFCSCTCRGTGATSLALHSEFREVVTIFILPHELTGEPVARTVSICNRFLTAFSPPLRPKRPGSATAQSLREPTDSRTCGNYHAATCDWKSWWAKQLGSGREQRRAHISSPRATCHTSYTPTMLHDDIPHSHVLSHPGTACFFSLLALCPRHSVMLWPTRVKSPRAWAAGSDELGTRALEGQWHRVVQVQQRLLVGLLRRRHHMGFNFARNSPDS